MARWARRDQFEGTFVTKDADDTSWDYPAHTKAKHDILDDYLGGWFATLSAFPRILFFDGFAGRGVYNDGTHGSPLIALNKLLTHTAFTRMSGCEFVFLFVEKEPKNAAILQKEIDALSASIGGFPKNVRVQVVEGEFKQVASDITEAITAQKKKQAPTFAFIDPFGYSGLPIQVIADFVQFKGSEVFVNFMVNHLGRFVGRAGQEAAVQDLFGMSPKEVMANFDDDQQRAIYLRDLYVQQLKVKAKFSYVNSFAMKNATGNIVYYLIHGTRHERGVELMKAAMWKADPGSGSVFSDRLAGEEVLFTLDPDLTPLANDFVRTFRGEARVPVSTLRRRAVLDTPYRETHVIPVLKQLEAARRIVVHRSKKTGYDQNTTFIEFP
jgi:three-Cys-motif partner protein